MSIQPRQRDDLNTLLNRHADELWADEMARCAAADPRADARPAGLRHDVDSLSHHYEQKTPEDLPARQLRSHAAYLSHRYARSADHVRRLIGPAAMWPVLSAECVQKDRVRHARFISACAAQAAILKEMRQSVRYWCWVHRHGRLPSCLVFWRHQFNSRRIAHPWTSITPETMETLASLDAQLHGRGTGGSGPPRSVAG